MKWIPFFPYYDLPLCLRCNVASAHLSRCCTSWEASPCKIFSVDVVARHCCKAVVLLTLWQWWTTFNELPASRPSERQRQPALGPWPAGPWAYISPATAHITNTSTTRMWQLNPSPTSPTYSLNKLESHWNVCRRTNPNEHADERRDEEKNNKDTKRMSATQRRFHRWQMRLN